MSTWLVFPRVGMCPVLLSAWLTEVEYAVLVGLYKKGDPGGPALEMALDCAVERGAWSRDLLIRVLPWGEAGMRVQEEWSRLEDDSALSSEYRRLMGRFRLLFSRSRGVVLPGEMSTLLAQLYTHVQQQRIRALQQQGTDLYTQAQEAALALQDAQAEKGQAWQAGFDTAVRLYDRLEGERRRRTAGRRG